MSIDSSNIQDSHLRRKFEVMLGNLRSKKGELYSPTLKWLKKCGLVSEGEECGNQRQTDRPSNLEFALQAVPAWRRHESSPETSFHHHYDLSDFKGIQPDSPMSQRSLPIPIPSPAGSICWSEEEFLMESPSSPSCASVSRANLLLKWARFRSNITVGHDPVTEDMDQESLPAHDQPAQDAIFALDL